jgi:hypothetical protein
MSGKSATIGQLIVEQKLDVMGLTETWLRGDRDNFIMADATPPGYNVLRLDRMGKRGGGLAVIASSGLCLKRLDAPIEMKTCELLYLQLMSSTDSSLPLRVGLIYRPPGSPRDFLCEFDELLSQLNHVDDITLMGDFNIHVDNTTDTSATALSCLIHQYGWSQHVNVATHDAGHILDLILTKKNSRMHIPSGAITLTAGCADHLAVIFQLSLVKPHTLKVWRHVRNLNKVDPQALWKDFWSIFCSTLSPLPTTSPDPNALLLMYENCATKAMEVHAPYRCKKLTLRQSPLKFGSELLRAKKTLRERERLWRTSGLTIDRDLFKNARNSYITLLRRDKDQMVRSKLLSPAASIKQKWSVLADCTGSTLKGARKKVGATISHQEARDRAVSFADFFSGKIAEIVRQLKPHKVSTTKNSDSDSPLVTEVLYELEHVTPTEIFGHLRSIQSRKSSPADPIPTSLLKKDRHICRLLADICNASFDTCTVPLALKQAIISPVLKKQGLDVGSPKNFRPVSNLKVVGKLIESAAASRLVHHLDKVAFLHPCQSAYRRRHSTETATLCVTNDWRRSLDQGKAVCVAALDVTAAFDTVDHTILLATLLQAGVYGRALKWFQSYLTDRTATVRCGDASSESITLNNGVPQGSILGPCLFNCYMAGLARELERSAGETGVVFHIYADDVLLYAECETENLLTGVARLQKAIQCVEEWMSAKCLLLSLEKTELLLLHNSRAKLPATLPSLAIGDKSIEFKNEGSLRWLGVYFDTCLSMTGFIAHTCRTCFSILRMIRLIHSRLDKASVLLLCNALIISRVDYCNSLLVACTKEDTNRLQRVMNLAARIVSGAHRHDHITPVLNDLGWLPIEKRIFMKVATLVFKCRASQAPTYLIGSLTEYRPRRPLRSSGSTATTFQLGTARIAAGRRAWGVAGPCTWNSLPVELRMPDLDYESFISLLSAYLFKSSNTL